MTTLKDRAGWRGVTMVTFLVPLPTLPPCAFGAVFVQTKSDKANCDSRKMLKALFTR